MKNEVIIGDCRDILPTFPDKSFDLAILDPPYYKIVNAEWDNQWRTFEEYLDWLENICLEVKRVLKDNGSLYVFGDDQRIAYVQARLDRHFTFLNHLVWYKRNHAFMKYAKGMRRYCPMSERVLFYGLQDQTGLQDIYENPDCFKPIKDYLKSEKEKTGLTNKDFNILFSSYYNKVGCLDRSVIEHYWQTSQWIFPTKEIYENILQSTGFFKRGYETLRKEYEDLRKEYEDLRRPFNYQEKIYEVIDIPIITGKENTSHPSTKPKELYKRLIQCSTNEGALILDPFAGSGTSLIAAKETGRYCIAIEKEEQYLPIILERGQLNTCTLNNFEEVV